MPAMTDTAHLEPGPEVPTAREVRAEIRDWRRGRAELRWGEVLSDGYIAIFCVVMIGAMGGNVVLTLRRLADDTCAGSCTEVRSAMPWLAALAVALLALGLARLLGPVFSPPAANAWLLSTPVDRGALLRPGWGRTSALAVVAAALVLLAPAVLGGFSLTEGAVFLIAGGATALACVGIAALSQVHENRVARVLTWVIAAGLWVLLSLSATRGAERSRTCRSASVSRPPRSSSPSRPLCTGGLARRWQASRDGSSATPRTCPPAFPARSRRWTSA
jgi:hypothetical protein